MKRNRQWYRARIRWAEMEERRGIRHWQEGLYLYRSADWATAFQRALELGEGGQGECEEVRHGQTRIVDTRLAEVVALDCLGDDLASEEPMEIFWIRLPAREKIAFDHNFEPAKKLPPPELR
jgi:hypothetical protein